MIRTPRRSLLDLPRSACAAWAVVAVVALGCLAGLALVVAAHHPGFSGLDRWAVSALTAPKDSRSLRLFEDVSLLGSVAAVVGFAVVAGVVVWIRSGDWRLGLVLIAGPGLAGTGEVVLKQVVGRLRPPTEVLTGERGFGFPSGHTSGATALALAVGVTIWVTRPHRRWSPVWLTLAAVYAVLIGLSRTIVGAHYATDVVGGVLLGTAATAGAVFGAAKLPRSLDRRMARLRLTVPARGRVTRARRPTGG